MPDAPRRQLIVASTNPGKIHEMQQMLADLQGWKLEAMPLGIPEIEESGATFVENAKLKACHYSRLLQGLALADDSGLCVTALDNRPGVWTARYGATAEARNRRVLDELGDGVQREAFFRCAFVVARAGEPIWSTETEIRGEIAVVPSGEGGFGFDPIFFVPELRKTLAQLTVGEKNRISARGRALTELRQFLLSS